MTHDILVIDDEEAIRKSFVLALEDTSYKVDTAQSGEQGIALFSNKIYGLVVLDLKMPGLNGVQTLRRLRTMDADVPIYILTAFHQEFFDQLKCAEQDGLDFELLRKPLNGSQITMLVESVIQNQPNLIIEENHAPVSTLHRG